MHKLIPRPPQIPNVRFVPDTTAPVYFVRRDRWHDLGRTGYAVPCPGASMCSVCRSSALAERRAA